MRSVHIKGYKSIKDAKINLKAINILIGANGSGKSNFLSFFTLLNNLYHQNLNMYVQLQGGTDKILHKGKKKTNYLRFKIDFNDINSYAVSTAVNNDDEFVFTQEILIYCENKWEISNKNKEAKIKEHQPGTNTRAKYVRTYLNQIKKYHFHDTGEKSPFTNASHVDNEGIVLYSNGANLAAFLYNIKMEDPLCYKIICKTIQSIAPYFLDFVLEPQNSLVRLLWRDRHSETIYGPNDFSDGTLRFIALAVLFLQPNLPKSIIIDEPELGLHPSAISKLAGLIQSAAKKGSQIICSTQSMTFINRFTPKDIITVDLINGESTFDRLDEEKLKVWLDDYTLGALWKKGIIKGQRNYE